MSPQKKAYTSKGGGPITKVGGESLDKLPMQGNFSPPNPQLTKIRKYKNNKNSVQILLMIGHNLCTVKALLQKINAIILSL